MCSDFFPWGTVLESDHRTGYVDFDSAVLFGQGISDATALSARKLHTKHPKRVEKYNKDVLRVFKDRRVFKSMNKLHHRAHRSGKWTKKMQHQYDTLDLQAMSIMLKAEQNYVQSFSQPAPWSVIEHCKFYLKVFWTIESSLNFLINYATAMY